MKKSTKSLSILAVIGVTFALTGASCYGDDYEERKANQQASQIVNSLEKQNLEKKRDREENPTAERYLYLLNAFGEPTGYYVTIGKVSSSASQIGPESEIIRGYGGEGYILDSAKDDGTYGAGDPGIFFFTSDDVMVETTQDYQLSDAPLDFGVEVPRLLK